MSSPFKVERGVEELADTPRFASRHYTVLEIATMWAVSDDTVRKIFEREPGVLVVCSQGARLRKRRYSSLRIPQDVLERVHRRMCRV